jgi:hypothetical protein
MAAEVKDRGGVIGHGLQQVRRTSCPAGQELDPVAKLRSSDLVLDRATLFTQLKRLPLQGGCRQKENCRGLHRFLRNVANLRVSEVDASPRCAFYVARCASSIASGEVSRTSLLKASKIIRNKNALLAVV